MFLLHKYHCVTPLRRGRRQVLVCELWQGFERRCNCLCNILRGPCACRLDSSSLHLRRNRSAFTDIGAVPFSYKSPMALKRAWTALAVGHRSVEAKVESVILYVVG